MILDDETEIIREYTPPKVNWDDSIAELEAFFSSTKLPSKSVKLDSGTTITDLPKFIKSHLTIAKSVNGKRIYLPYLERLQQLKNILSQK